MRRRSREQRLIERAGRMGRCVTATPEYGCLIFYDSARLETAIIHDREKVAAHWLDKLEWFSGNLTRNRNCVCMQQGRRLILRRVTKRFKVFDLNVEDLKRQ
jgi:hypothetical protein